MKQPTIEDEKELQAINDDSVTVIEIPRSKKKFKIGYIKPYAQERFTKLILEAEPKEPNSELTALTDMSKRSSLVHRSAAMIILNNWYKIKLFYPILWRWMFYVKEYDQDQLLPIVIEGKKKIQLESYLINMGFLGMMMETKKLMTTKEARVCQAELSSAFALNSGS